MVEQLSTQQWREIATLWRELGELAPAGVDEARRRAAQGLSRLLGGSNVLTVVQKRVAPASSSLGGMRAVFSCDFGPELDRRRRILEDWKKNESGMIEDPFLKVLARGVGTHRSAAHREDLSARQWDRAPVRRLLDEIGLVDRLNGVVPLGPDVEVTFCVDRPRGESLFDEHDKHLMATVIQGLRPLAKRFAQSRGLLHGQSALDPLERHLLELLLSDRDEADIVDLLGLSPARVRAVTAEVYRKLGVANRVELMSLWLDGARRDRRLLDDLLDDEAADVSRSPAEQVRHELRCLEPREFDIEVVARRLCTSVRSLQRNLSDADVSYRELVDEVRRERAEQLLARPSLSFTEIALRLGYGQVSSFNRAVRRWTGKTPGEFRDALVENG